jgi:hypothetical protein
MRFIRNGSYRGSRAHYQPAKISHPKRAKKSPARQPVGFLWQLRACKPVRPTSRIKRLQRRGRDASKLAGPSSCPCNLAILASDRMGR